MAKVMLVMAPNKVDYIVDASTAPRGLLGGYSGATRGLLGGYSGATWGLLGGYYSPRAAPE